MARVREARARLSAEQARWLERGLGAGEGRLPLFDAEGQRISERTVRSCLDHGLIEPLHAHPAGGAWAVYRLTALARARLGARKGRR